MEHPWGPGLPLQRWGDCDGSSKHGPLVSVMIGLLNLDEGQKRKMKLKAVVVVVVVAAVVVVVVAVVDDACLAKRRPKSCNMFSLLPRNSPF